MNLSVAEQLLERYMRSHCNVQGTIQRGFNVERTPDGPVVEEISALDVIQGKVPVFHDVNGSIVSSAFLWSNPPVLMAKNPGEFEVAIKDSNTKLDVAEFFELVPQNLNELQLPFEDVKPLKFVKAGFNPSCPCELETCPFPYPSYGCGPIDCARWSWYAECYQSGLWYDQCCYKHEVNTDYMCQVPCVLVCTGYEYLTNLWCECTTGGAYPYGVWTCFGYFYQAL